MTLANFPFDLLELMLVQKRSNALGYEGGGAVLKVAGIFVNFVWVIVSASTQNAPDAGSTALVVVACLAEIFLLERERERCLYWINQSDRLKGVPETSTLPS